MLYIVGLRGVRGLKGSANMVDDRCPGMRREVLFEADTGRGAANVDERLGAAGGRPNRREDVALRVTELVEAG
jgi:hypothetical protein